MTRAFAALLVALLLLFSPRTWAEPPIQNGGDPPPDPGSLDIVAVSTFGQHTLPPAGWGEIVVRIQNHGSEPEAGLITVLGDGGHVDDDGSRSTAPFSCGAGASVTLRVPLRVSDYQDPLVWISDDAGKTLYKQTLVRATDNRTLLVDVAKASALGSALSGIRTGSRNDPWEASPYGSATPTPTTIHVASPLYDTVTGDALLPRRAAGYARAATVLMRSDELVRLAAIELEALAGYVMAGGTLAIVITRPEDERHRVVVSLVGGRAVRGGVHQQTLQDFALNAPAGRTGHIARPAPVGAQLDGAVAETLVGFTGGNLHPTSYGSSAPYGLGEVHLLAFDAQRKPAVDSPWVHARMIDLLRRANERLTGVLFRPGGTHYPAVEVRRQLDPNESSRWAIVLAALLLCVYSVIAGPVNYTYWRRKGHPLRTLLWLPIIAAVAFGAVVVVGISAKGCTGRARHLTMVEAGAGMQLATARKWRGLFVPSSRRMTVRTGSASSVVGTELMSHGGLRGSVSSGDVLRVDRDGLRLVDLQLRPWETLVIREDGYVSLGEGIALVRNGPTETTVYNRTGRRLLGLVLWQPGSGAKFLTSLDDGANASSSSFAPATAAVLGGASTPTTLAARDFNVHAIDSELDGAAGGLTNAWSAVVDAIPDRKDWFPQDVPVLLAQVEGGEGQTTDSGLQIDSDRLLVRIVGYGGTP